MTEPRRPSRPSSAPVFWGALALFTVLFALLTYQLASSTAPAKRPVLVRKVIKKRVVTTVVPSPGAAGAGAGPVVTSSAPEVASSGAAPVTTGAS
jgi:hypothetical protein